MHKPFPHCGTSRILCTDLTRVIRRVRLVCIMMMTSVLQKHSHGATREARKEVHVSTETALIYFACLAACSLFMMHREIRSVRHLWIKKRENKKLQWKYPNFVFFCCFFRELLVSYSYWRLSAPLELNFPGQKPGKHKVINFAQILFVIGLALGLHLNPGVTAFYHLQNNQSRCAVQGLID